MSRLLSAAALSLVLLGTGLAPSAGAQTPPPPLPMETLNQRTPYVAFTVEGTCDTGRRILACRSYGEWVASCPDTYTFDKGTDTTRQVQVRNTLGQAFVAQTKSTWLDNHLSVYSNFPRIKYTPPVPTPDNPNPLSGYWADPVPFQCTRPTPAPTAVQARDTTEHQAVHRTRTVPVSSRGQTVRLRLRCAPGSRLPDSHVSVGVYSKSRPSRRHARLIRARHMRFTAHTATDVRVHKALPRSPRVALQLHTECLPPS